MSIQAGLNSSAVHVPSALLHIALFQPLHDALAETVYFAREGKVTGGRLNR